MSAWAILAPLVEPLIKVVASAIGASREQEATMLRAAHEYIRNIPAPKDAALAPDYRAAREGALESPPMTIDDADVESVPDPYKSDR